MTYCVAVFDSGVFAWTGKEGYFWQAVGLSMVGGVIMVHAQLLRSRLLVHNEGHDLWGPDLLMNMLVIAALPLAFFFLGIQAVVGLSLLGALLALLFYKSSELNEISMRNEHIALKGGFQLFAAFLVLVPLFISFESGLFHSAFIPETGNSSLVSLPVPISLFLTYIGILLIGAYRAARLSIGMIFFTFVAMVFTTLMVADGRTGLDSTKLILIIQCVLPMGALALGEMLKTDGLDTSVRVEKTFLAILLMVVPFQLISSWVQGSLTLSGYLYVFSIYQHLDYVPIIFVAAFLLALFALWQVNGHRNALLIFSPVMGIYVAASLSLTAMVFLVGGLSAFAVTRWREGAEKMPLGICLAVFVTCLVYLNAVSSYLPLLDRFSDWGQSTLDAWGYYADQVANSLKTLMLGNEDSVDRSRFTSAHNYYLDVIRNFGALSILPILLVIGYTVRISYAARRQILSNMALQGHLLVLLFLLAIDNSTQVGLRQPYPGVFIFFVWGLFIAKLAHSNHFARQKYEVKHV
ncbi:MAG: hypothetical protein KGZ88_09470 [Methylomicrobium sp.]|nr:hypothetical protein [Methylomicrobium sp.]